MPSDPDPSEMRDHYDFGPAANPVRGKYFEKYRQGTNIVLIDPDLAKRFPNSDAVNAALRQLIDLMPDTATGGNQ
jgi:hypothetical protein